MPECSSLLIIFYGILAIIAYYVLHEWLKPKKYNLPPGPRPWPIIGNIPDPYSSPQTYKTLMTKWVKKYGDVILFKRLGINFIYINDYKICHQAFVQNHPIDLAGRPVNGMDRYSVGKNNVFFTRSMDESFIEIRKLIMSNLRKVAEPHRMVDMTNSCYELFAEYIVKTKARPTRQAFYVEPFCYWLGHNLLAKIFYTEEVEYDSEEYQDTIATITELMDRIGNLGFFDITPLNSLPIPEKKKILKLSYKLSGKILKQIKDRRENKLHLSDPKYFIDYTIQMQEKQLESPEKFPNLPTIDDTYASNLALDIYFAGLDAFGIGFTWTIGLLALYPEVQQKIRNELDQHDISFQLGTASSSKLVKNIDELHYLNSVISEIMRFHSLSAFTSFHRAQKDVKINGFDVPKNTIVVANIHGTHFDPRYWKDPQKFWPERFLNEEGKYQLPKEGFMPFGVGRRICVAERYSVKETHVVITARLCQEFNLIWSSENSTKELLEDDENNFFRHTAKFLVEFEPLNQ